MLAARYNVLRVQLTYPADAYPSLQPSLLNHVNVTCTKYDVPMDETATRQTTTAASQAKD